MADPTIEEHYHDADGNPCTLDKLCRTEPEWAANVIRSLKRNVLGHDALATKLSARVAELERENAELAEALQPFADAAGMLDEYQQQLAGQLGFTPRIELVMEHAVQHITPVDLHNARVALAGRGGKSNG